MKATMIPRGVQAVILIAGLALVLSASRSYVRREGDLRLYVGLGETVLAGGHIYRDLPPGGATWPPLFALLCVPVALVARLGPRVVRFAWIAANLVALFLVMRMLARAVYGKALSLVPRRGAFSLASPEMLVPLAFAGVFINDNLVYLQVNVLILAIVVAGICRMADGREAGGGALIGVAAALKVMPGLFIPYLLWRRRWRGAAAAVAAFVLCSIAPAAVFGWRRFLDFCADWPRAVGCGWGVNGPNQSLYAMCDRFLGGGRGWAAAYLPRGYVAPSGDPVVLAATGVLAAILLVMMARAMPPAGAWNRRIVLVEGGAVVAASALLGPLAWLHYFVALLVPVTVLLGFLWQGLLPRSARRAAPWALAGYALLVFPSSSGLAGHSVAGVWLNLSAVTMAALGAIGASLWARGWLGRNDRLEGSHRRR